MTTLAAFNNMLKAFLEELADVFPEQQDVATFLAGFDTFVALSPRKPMDTLMAALTPHAQLLMTKDAALFASLQFPGLDFNAMWSSEGVTDNTREAIWQYLHSLFLLGTTMQQLPPELLQSIESVAHECAEKMQGQDVDFGTMANALMGMSGPGLANMLPGLGGGGGGAPPRTTRPARTTRRP